MSNPFHRVSYYTGMQYREAWLRDAGVFIQIFPRSVGSNKCPGYEDWECELPADIDTKPPPLYGSAAEATDAIDPTEGGLHNTDCEQHGPFPLCPTVNIADPVSTTLPPFLSS